MATRSEQFAWLTDNWAKWGVVAASFCVLFVVKGTVATYGVFITPIESDFGWSRTTISFTFTIYLLATAVASPVTGNLIDRYGAAVFPVFIFLVAAPLMVLSRISSVEHLYGLYVVVGLAVTGLSLSHFSSIITKWFGSGTLLASGVALSGFSIGQLVFNPVAAELILAYDWRTAYLAFGALSLAMIPLAYFGIRGPGTDTDADTDVDAGPDADTDPHADVNTDTDVGTNPDPDPEATPDRTDGATAPDREGDADPAQSTDAVEVPVRDALTSSSLWLLVVTFFICGFTTVGLMTTHFVPYLQSIGFSGSLAAQGQGVMGGMTVFGLLAMGAVGDRYTSGKRYLLASIYVLRGVTLLFLLAVSSVVGMFLFATVYGFLTLCTVPLHAGITADRFGSEHLTTLVGLQYMGHQTGGATAALAAGWIFDTMGSYRPAHLLGVGLLAIAPILVVIDRTGRPTAA